MSQTKLSKTHTEHLHIDNGGITISIIDDGPVNGIQFKLSSQYYGYPCLDATMRIEEYSGQILEKFEKVIKAAREDLQNIDWEKRYNSQ